MAQQELTEVRKTMAVHDLLGAIHSIMIVRDGGFKHVVQNESQSHLAPDLAEEAAPSAVEEPYILVVSDIYDRVRYTVTPTRQHYQLHFQLKEGEAIVEVERGCDITEVAARLATYFLAWL